MIYTKGFGAELVRAERVLLDVGPEDGLEENDYARMWALDARDKNEWVEVVDRKTVERTQAVLKETLDDALTQTSFLHPDTDRDLYYDSHSTKDDSLPDIAIARLCSYLIAGSIEPGQIRTCDQCKMIFLAKRKPSPRKKSYCSTRCAQLCATRAYRKRNQAKLKTKERERSHHRYVAKQRKEAPERQSQKDSTGELGRHVVIARADVKTGLTARSARYYIAAPESERAKHINSQNIDRSLWRVRDAVW